MSSDPKEKELSAVNINANASTRLNLPVYESLFLLSGKTEAVIKHAGEEYRLRLTRQGKLILTK